jgi:hypothetical protein
MKKKIIVGFMFTLACIGLTGCSTNKVNQAKNTNESSESTQNNYSDGQYALMAYLKLQGQSVDDLNNNKNEMDWNKTGNTYHIDFGAHGTAMKVTQDNVEVTYDEAQGDSMGQGNGHKTYSKQQLANEYGSQKSKIQSILNYGSNEDRKGMQGSESEPIIGSFSNKDIKTALNVYDDGTAHYVFYDPENGNTDDKDITWKSMGKTRTAKSRYEMDFHDSNISAPIILIVKDPNTVVLTSKDPNWSQQTLYRSMTRIDLKQFLAAGGNADNYEYRGPENKSSSNNDSESSEDENTELNGISESKARALVAAHGGNTAGLKGFRTQNSWEFFDKDLPIGSPKYTVTDDGQVG